jgi:SP family arabinose:H+ symporter-like MFS transporter
MTLSRPLVKSTVVAALGGLLFGFDTVVISGTIQALTSAYALSPQSVGFTVSIAVLGTVFGAMLAGIPGDRYGRRDSLRILAVFYLVSALGCAFAWDWYSLVLFRFIGGLGIGGSSVLGPMYIAEIAPAKWRGRLVGFFQFNIVAGILIAYLSNYLIGLRSFGATEWRWELGVAAIPALLFLIMLFTIPRSPRWLVKKGRPAEAREVLHQIGEENVEAELKDMIAAVDLEHGRAQEPLFSAKFKLPLFLAISIAMFNQLSGINAILYYLNTIFAGAGTSKSAASLEAVAIGATNLVFTVLAMSIIDRVGRRTLLLIGSVGTAACLAGVAAIFKSGTNQGVLVWLLMGFIAFFAFSQGAVIWVYLSEVFPTSVRARGQSLGSTTHWVMNWVISQIFPIISAWSKPAPFVLFASMMALQFFVVYFIYPETKGVSLEDMQKKLATA